VADSLERIATEIVSSRLDSSIDEEMVERMQARCAGLLEQSARLPPTPVGRSRRAAFGSVQGRRGNGEFDNITGRDSRGKP
jgi:phenylpropionate dioxygenase-like ring-hydroxylating dioxygenase large terminal subunit